MLSALRPWVEIESPTFDAARMNTIRGARLRAVGRGNPTHPLGFGDCVRAKFSFGHADKPGILSMGHLDTGAPGWHARRFLPWRRDGERCYGPGIFDMKGGNFIALEAVRMLQRLGLPRHCR